MPDLGKYAVEVGLAYGVSLALLAGLVLGYWLRSASVKRRLYDVENRAKKTPLDGD